MPMQPDLLVLHASDSVAIATVKNGAIPAGHKIARNDIAKGDAVRKFGQIIGVATADIAAGSHVHSHNLAMSPHDRNYRIGSQLARAKAAVPQLPARQFMGYPRDDGRVGTRNTIALCATVNCSASVIRQAALEIENEGILAAFANIDGICAFAHGTGCGMAQDGPGFAILDRVLWGHANHPNVAAAIFVGLGCEVMQVARMQRERGDGKASRFHFLTIQGTGGTRATIDAIKTKVREILPLANAAKRRECPVSGLMIALQCGGSDGFSGLTANPALGIASDMIVGLGGTVILSETPEIYGAESLLLDRSCDAATAERLIDCLRWWEDYTAANGASLDNNPSPGNKLGGLTTILEKSLGAVAKGGSTPLAGFANYAEQVTEKGLVFMDTPGFDPVSATGQIAGGAQIVCFTTGRGSAFGSKPAPTIKLATNDALYRQMPDDMDINCGDIITQGLQIADKGHAILDEIIAVASGKVTKSEALNLGANEFVPWQLGAVL